MRIHRVDDEVDVFVEVVLVLAGSTSELVLPAPPVEGAVFWVFVLAIFFLVFFSLFWSLFVCLLSLMGGLIWELCSS